MGPDPVGRESRRAEGPVSLPDLSASDLSRAVRMAFAQDVVRLQRWVRENARRCHLHGAAQIRRGHDVWR
jgi:hypothetical protein